MTINLVLYTKTECVFCEIMKTKLKDWGYYYNEVNLDKMPENKQFMKQQGHKTVPQLYWNNIHLNKVDTNDFSKNHLEEALNLDDYAGGVEYWGS